MSSIDADDVKERQQQSRNKHQILNLFPVAINANNRSKNNNVKAEKDYTFKNSREQKIAEQNRKRTKNQAAIDQFGYSNASSGRWRKPAGGASAGISSEGANTFSIVTHKDVNSAFNPVRPSMMFQTMYSGGAANIDNTYEN